MKYSIDDINNIKQTIISINTYTPVLLIGGAVIYFKQRYKGKINILRNIEDTRNFVADNLNKVYDKPLVIDGIGDLTPNAQATLLKYIEEARTSIFLLSEQDTVSEIIKSRCRRVSKLPLSETVSNRMYPAAKAAEALREYLQENTAPDDREKWIAQNSCALYNLEFLVNGKSNKEKLIQLLS